MKRLITIFSVALAGAFGAARTAAAAEVDAVRGSTKGVVTDDPQWSAGIQLGNSFGMGLSAQRVGFYDGALNLVLGTWLGGFAITGDYLFLYTSDLERMTLTPTTTYNQLRGEVQPYWGFGASAGWGIAARLPFGVQYTMLRDPFTFYGGGALVVGSLRVDNDDDVKLRAGFALSIGARMLL